MRRSLALGASSALAVFVVFVACGDGSGVEDRSLELPSGSDGAVETSRPTSDATYDVRESTRADDAGDAAEAEAPAVTPAACTRGAEAINAPPSLYDTFASDMLLLTGPARVARVDTFLAAVTAAGGSPLEDPATGRTVFVKRGAPPASGWSVFGSFVDGDRQRAVSLNAVPGTDLWVLDTNFPRSTSHSYRFLSGTEPNGDAEDPLARNVVWDGIIRGTSADLNLGRFDGVIHASSMSMSKGRIVRHGLQSGTLLRNQRVIYVYFPPTYDDGSCSPLPSIVFNDGSDVLSRGDYASIADAVYAATPSLSAVLIFASLSSADLNQRAAEYTFGNGTRGTDYVAFLANDLWPAMRSTYRVCTRQEARGLSGVSFGGLSASFSAFEMPAEWGWVGAQSASYWWSSSALVTRVSTTAKIQVRFYVDSSCPNDNCAEVDAFAAALGGRGYDYQRVKIDVPVQPPDPHDFAFFKQRVPQLLTHFRQGQTICN